MPAGMISQFVIEKRVSPAFGGRSFGSAGTYELIVGLAYGNLDPHAPENAQIFDLDKASLNSEGQVDYSTQVAILRPVDMRRGSGKLFYEVINRSVGTINFEGQTTNGLFSMLDLFLSRGDIVVAAAWEGEIARTVPLVPDAVLESFGGSPMCAALPGTSVGGKPVVRRIRQTLSVYDAVGIADLNAVRLEYPIAEGSTLEVWARSHEAQHPSLVPAQRVRLSSNDRVQIDAVSGATIYDIIYDATDPVVSGVGLAIPRDLISFLRYDHGDATERINPLADSSGHIATHRAYAYGISQSGRYLRYFLWRGFNCDTQGRVVFDGIVPVIAGGKKGSFNGLFATPSVIPGGQVGHRELDIFPFASRDSPTRAYSSVVFNQPCDLHDCCRSRSSPLSSKYLLSVDMAVVSSGIASRHYNAAFNRNGSTA